MFCNMRNVTLAVVCCVSVALQSLEAFRQSDLDQTCWVSFHMCWKVCPIPPDSSSVTESCLLMIITAKQFHFQHHQITGHSYKKCLCVDLKTVIWLYCVSFGVMPFSSLSGLLAHVSTGLQIIDTFHTKAHSSL